VGWGGVGGHEYEKHAPLPHPRAPCLPRVMAGNSDRLPAWCPPAWRAVSAGGAGGPLASTGGPTAVQPAASAFWARLAGSVAPTAFWARLAGSAALLSVCALVSGATIAFVALDDTRVALAAAPGAPRADRRRAARVAPLLARHHLVLVSLLVWNAVANEALPVVLAGAVGEALAIPVAAVAVLVFGEVIPSAALGSHPLRVTAALSEVLWVAVAAAAPVAWPLAKALDVAVGRHRGGSPTPGRYGRGELRALLRLHGEGGGRDADAAAAAAADAADADDDAATTASADSGGGIRGAGDDAVVAVAGCSPAAAGGGPPSVGASAAAARAGPPSTRPPSPRPTASDAGTSGDDDSGSAGGGGATAAAAAAGTVRGAVLWRLRAWLRRRRAPSPPPPSDASVVTGRTRTATSPGLTAPLLDTAQPPPPAAREASPGPARRPPGIIVSPGASPLSALATPVPVSLALSLSSTGNAADTAGGAGGGERHGGRPIWRRLRRAAGVATPSRSPRSPSESTASSELTAGMVPSSPSTPGRRGRRGGAAGGGRSGGGTRGGSPGSSSPRSPAGGDGGGGAPLSSRELSILEGALDLRNVPVESRAIPLARVFMVPAGAPLDAATLRAIAAAGHSRVPVYRGGDRSDIAGVLLVKMLLAGAPGGWAGAPPAAPGAPAPEPPLPATVGAAPLVRPLVLHPRTSLLEALRRFQTTGRSHLALVTPAVAEVEDALGAGGARGAARPAGAGPPPSPRRRRVLGVITLEDCLEALLRVPIEDEMDVLRAERAGGL
jgi:CBS domain containing-hemolysin-like protein